MSNGFTTWFKSLFSNPPKSTVPTERPTVSSGGHIEPAIELIKEFEGFRTKAYLDPVGIPTIGFGRTKGVKLGLTTTLDKELKHLMEDITSIRIPAIVECVDVPISNNELCALISFIYNVGTGAFTKSTLLKKLNANAPKTEVAAEFDKWVYAGGKVLKGLVNRRQKEKRLFLTPDLT